jgi:hypothetical protein
VGRGRGAAGTGRGSGAVIAVIRGWHLCKSILTVIGSIGSFHAVCSHWHLARGPGAEVHMGVYS